MIDLLVAKDLIEHGTVQIRWVPTGHMLADMLTKAMTPPAVAETFLRDGLYSLVQTEEAQQREAYRLALRQGQRARRKARKDDTAKQSLSRTAGSG